MVLSAFLALAAGCGDDGGGGGGGGAGGGGPGGESIALATYNAGLAYGFVGYAEERAPLVPPALAELDVDVLCVNEVWMPDDVAAVKQALAAKLPNQAFFADSQEFADAPPCSQEAIDELVACVEPACGSEPAADCVLANCGAEFNAQSSECKQCLASNVGGTIDDLTAVCSGDGAVFAYGGAFGVGLLTNQTVVAQEGLVLEGSTINRRGVQYMELDVGGTPVHVFCTHLTANLTLEYPRDEGSWEAEQAAQIDTIHGWIAERAGDETAILLGDLNTGPAGDGFSAELPDNWEKLTTAGWSAPFIEQAPQCTYCGDNPLVGSAGDDVNSVLIDQVLFQRASGTFSAGRILDADVTLETEADGTVTSKLSDHYGVRVEWTR
jgi:hypothetical protein